MVTPAVLGKLERTKAHFESLRPGKADLLTILDESELPEAVYNSNAIENSTLTLEDTERILLAVEVSRHMDLREIHEAQNLARVSQYVRAHHSEPLDLDTIALLHKMLLSNIDDSIAGRFRRPGEYVRVGTHVAPAPEQVEALLSAMLIRFESDQVSHVVARLAVFHLEFERIHPFNDGNGRIGRLLINYQLYRLGFPPVIVRNRTKSLYYSMLREFDATSKTSAFESHLTGLMLEALHRRIAYLAGAELMKATDFARRHHIASNTFLNHCRRQIVPAFRERNEWKIPANFKP